MKIITPNWKKQARKKKRLRAEADRLWHIAGLKKWGNICFFHGSGKEARNHQRTTKHCHHYKEKSIYGHLRYNLEIAVPACWACHYKTEKVDRTMIVDIAIKRGKRWLNKVEKLAKDRPTSSYQSIGYYQGIIKGLKE